MRNRSPITIRNRPRPVYSHWRYLQVFEVSLRFLSVSAPSVSLCDFRKLLRSCVLTRCQRFSTFALCQPFPFFCFLVCFPVRFSTLLTGEFICNYLYLNWLSDKSLAKRCQWKVVLADSFLSSNLAMRSISESYRECVRNYACQEGRNFAPVQANKPNSDT